MAVHYNTFPSSVTVYDNGINLSAISVQQVNVRFGIGSKKKQILKDVSINVDQGTIFGLLGPSGCGKTTLLKCIIARIKPYQGKIKVFDQTPGSVASEIPGSGVGYMPQELAIYPELTIAEILFYFGRLYGINAVQLKNRIKFLFEFLDLPERNDLIENLSGGQKRRTSFAIALLHQPPLLILDEPTVGVDPVMRKNIWNYLVKIASTENVSIVITTHYIEEARNAHKIAFMRDGIVLAQDKPDNLLHYHKLSSLEDVFLKLCEEGKISGTDFAVNHAKQYKKIKSSATPNQDNFEQPPESQNKWQKRQSRFSTFNRIKALTILSFIRLWRNKLLFFLHFLNPAFQIFIYCWSIGDGPKHVPVAIFNQDNILGAEYLNYINNKTIQQIAVQSQNEGEDLVRQGKAWAVVSIWPNFTHSLAQRFLTHGHVSHELIQASAIHVRSDNSDQMIYYALETTLLTAYNMFANDSIQKIDKSFKIPSNPLKFEKPIYGHENPKAMNSILPGILMCTVFSIAICLSAIGFTKDKTSGLMERLYVAGATAFEVICGSLCTQLFIIFIQTTIFLVIARYGFNIKNEGSTFLLVFLTALQGLNGMTSGFLISAVFNDDLTAMQIALGLTLPLFLSSGTVAPIETMPKFLQIGSQFQPLTVPLTGASWIFTHGKDITFFLVWRGFLISVIWIIIFLVLSLIVMYIRRN